MATTLLVVPLQHTRDCIIQAGIKYCERMDGPDTPHWAQIAVGVFIIMSMIFGAYYSSSSTSSPTIEDYTAGAFGGLIFGGVGILFLGFLLALFMGAF